MRQLVNLIEQAEALLKEARQLPQYRKHITSIDPNLKLVQATNLCSSLINNVYSEGIE